MNDAPTSPLQGLSDVKGTFACPICGMETPHHHPDDQVAAYQEDQVRNDGWINMRHKLPRPVGARGFYLIRGHRLDVPTPDYNNVSYNAYQRVAEAHGYPAEVAEWDGSKFILLHWSGNARVDGAEGRRPVFIRPTHWRVIPPFGIQRPDSKAPDAVDSLSRPPDALGRWMPKEPTEEMQRAGWNAYVADMEGGFKRFVVTYRAMYDAAPAGLLNADESVSRLVNLIESIPTLDAKDQVIGARWAVNAVRALAGRVAATSAPGFAKVPLKLTRAMEEVIQGDDWQWEDLLAAAEAIDEEQYKTISATSAPSAQVPRTCSDERPCIPCFTDKGDCLGPAGSFNVTTAQGHSEKLLALKLTSWTDLENYGEKFCEAFNAGVSACIDALAASSAVVLQPDAREPEPRLDWAIRTLTMIKASGRDAPLGDNWPELVSVIGALKFIAAQQLAATDAPSEPKFDMPHDPELFALIGEIPLIASLLYDLNLMPEEIESAKHWNYMTAICKHMQIALAAAAPDAPTEAAPALTLPALTLPANIKDGRLAVSRLVYIGDKNTRAPDFRDKYIEELETAVSGLLKATATKE